MDMIREEGHEEAYKIWLRDPINPQRGRERSK